MTSFEQTSSPCSSTPDSAEPLTPNNKNDAFLINYIPSKEQENNTPLKWCQRCGTAETPRWRYGPAGISTLCNACHLKWKTQGKPIEGYSSTVFPPPYHDPSRQLKTIRKKYTKKTLSDQSQPQPKSKPKSKPLPQTQPQPQLNKKSSIKNPNLKVLEIVTTSEIKQNICHQCLTTETPLWRKGPLGPKTLCNACGLKWSKSTPNTEPVTIENQVKKPLKKKQLSLFHKKDFLKQGLYYDHTRIKSIETSFKFELPLHLGQALLEKTIDFELPAYLHQERELGWIKGPVRVPFFTRIRSNLFVERKAQTGQKDPVICHCIPPKDTREMGCGDDCINRMLFYECDARYCPCGQQCGNQRFQRKERTKELEIYQTESRGWGLLTKVDIKRGDLVIEYRGEIISQKMCEERMCSDYVNEKNFYFLDYQNGEVIDATTKGTEARFINHSCEPNCHIEKWSCRGESHLGVFASKNIPAGSELFYDYNFSTFNGSVESQQICHCASSRCRGVIGRKVASRSK